MSFTNKKLLSLDEQNSPKDYSNYFTILTWVTDIWFLIDLLMNFHTGIYDTTKEGHCRMIVKKQEIADTYWQFKNFWIDFVSSIPFDVVGRIITARLFKIFNR